VQQQSRLMVGGNYTPVTNYRAFMATQIIDRQMIAVLWRCLDANARLI